MKSLPKSKTDSIVIQNLRDEVLIYNLRTDEAFCLNKTSADVFNACDGETRFDDLKARHHYSDDIICLALDGLKKVQLIDPDYISPFAGMSRREAIRRAGLASMIVLPIVSSLAAPRAAAAASTQNCSSPANCPVNRPVCADIIGSPQKTCCTAGAADRFATGQQAASSSGVPGSCTTFDCNTTFPQSAAACCSGSLQTGCTQTGANTYDYVCTCT